MTWTDTLNDIAFAALATFPVTAQLLVWVKFPWTPERRRP